MKLLILSINIFHLLVSVVFATQPANVTIVAEFLDCLKIHNATDYGLNVTKKGHLTVAPLYHETPPNFVDMTPFSICNHLFGIGFYGSFWRGVHVYDPDAVLIPLEEVNAEILVGEGMIARESLPRPSNAAEYSDRLNSFLRIGENMGFDRSRLEEVIGTNFTGPRINSGKRSL
jgi:hypothetical protein